MFRATLCSSSGESIVSIQHLVYVTLCRWPSGMHTGRSPTQTDIYQILNWYNWLSWWWAQGCSKHVENRHIYKKGTVRQVGYLLELFITYRHLSHARQLLTFTLYHIVVTQVVRFPHIIWEPYVRLGGHHLKFSRMNAAKKWYWDTLLQIFRPKCCMHLSSLTSIIPFCLPNSSSLILSP
jgi:hypothetical protein